MLILSLIFSPVLFAQNHQHDDTMMEKRVNEVVKLTEKPINLNPVICPDPKDRSYVNFHMDHLKDPPGFHGMLFFGQGDSFYISHLPMFHSPHDYQAIVEVRLPPDVKAKYQAELKRKGGYFTFAPDGDFILPEVVSQKRPISGVLFQGHFERRGTEFLKANLELVRVVFYKKISEKDKKPTKEKYIIFGNGEEYFMAHEIFERPNVDEIIPLPKNYPLSSKLRNDIKENGIVFINDLSIKDKKVKAAGSIEFSYQEFYRETGDLE